jgi:hypothetical protein
VIVRLSNLVICPHNEVAAMRRFDNPGIVKRRSRGADDETTGRDFEGDGEENGERCGKMQSPAKQRASHFPTATTATAPLKPKKQAARAA